MHSDDAFSAFFSTLLSPTPFAALQTSTIAKIPNFRCVLQFQLDLSASKVFENGKVIWQLIGDANKALLPMPGNDLQLHMYIASQISTSFS